MNLLENFKTNYYGVVPLPLFEAMVKELTGKTKVLATPDPETTIVSEISTPTPAPTETVVKEFPYTERTFNEVLGRLNRKDWESVAAFVDNKNVAPTTARDCIAEGVRRGLVDVKPFEPEEGKTARPHNVFRLSPAGREKYPERRDRSKNAPAEPTPAQMEVDF